MQCPHLTTTNHLYHIHSCSVSPPHHHQPTLPHPFMCSVPTSPPNSAPAQPFTHHPAQSSHISLPPHLTRHTQLLTKTLFFSAASLLSLTLNLYLLAFSFVSILSLYQAGSSQRVKTVWPPPARLSSEETPFLHQMVIPTMCWGLAALHSLTGCLATTELDDILDVQDLPHSQLQLGIHILCPPGDYPQCVWCLKLEFEGSWGWGGGCPCGRRP